MTGDGEIPGNEAREIRLGDFTLDLASPALTGPHGATRLDPKDLSVLRHLLRDAPAVVATEALLAESWPGVVVGDNALQQVIARLRKAFDDDARKPRYIETRARQGYRLMVEPVPVAGAAPASHGQARPAGRRPAAGVAVVVLLVSIVLASFWWSQDSAPDRAEEIVVAVVPFENLSADTAEAGKVEAFRTAVANQLSKISALRVITPFIVDRTLAGGTADVTRLQTLGVNRLVTGQVLIDGQRLAVFVSGVNLTTGEQLLAQQYDGGMEDFIALNGEIALTVADKFNAVWAPEEAAAIARPPTSNADAFRLVLESQAIVQLVGGVEETELAVGLLRRALQLDPEFTDAMGMLSWAYRWQALLGVPDAAAQARVWAERAMARDPDNGWARFAMGHVHLLAGDFREGIRHLRVGVERLPTLTSQVDDLSALLAVTGNLVEGLHWGLEAYKLWPTGANSQWHFAVTLTAIDANERAAMLVEAAIARRLHDLGRNLRHAAYLALLADDVQRAKALTARIPAAASHPEKRLANGVVAAFAEDHTAARGHFEAVYGDSPGFKTSFFAGTAGTWLALVLRRQGEAERADAILEQALAALASSRTNDPRDALIAASAYAQLHREADALDALERAFELGYRSFRFIEIDPQLESLKAAPRFKAVVDAMRADTERQRAQAEREGLFRRVDDALNALPGPAL